MKKFTLYETYVGLGNGGEYVWEICLTSDFRHVPKNSWFGGKTDKLGEFDTVEELSKILYETCPDYYTDEADAYEEDGKRLFDLYCKEV